MDQYVIYSIDDNKGGSEGHVIIVKANPVKESPGFAHLTKLFGKKYYNYSMNETDETELTTKKGSGDDEKSGGGSVGDDDSNLPQTGLLWWPVIPLLVIGFVLICIGVKIKNSGEKFDE